MSGPDEQVETEPISVFKIMRHPQFARGLDDVRNGRRFDDNVPVDDAWFYERGRQFGCNAPLSMRLWIGKGRLNPEAVRLYAAACERRWII